MRNRDYDDNIVNIDGSRHNPNKEVKPAGRGIFSRMKPEYIGVFIFLIVFVYLGINIYIYSTKKETAIYEVQAENLSYNTIFRGIAVRDEILSRSDYGGYINYYISNGKRVAKSNIVYSIDAGSSVYNKLNEDYSELNLNADEIASIKKIIKYYTCGDDIYDMSWTDEMQSDISSMLSDIINEKMIESMKSITASEDRTTLFHTVRSSRSGVVSYRADEMCGIIGDDIDRSSFMNDKGEEKTCNIMDLRSNGLVGEGDAVFRICPNENWEVVVMVDEQFYTENIEKHNASVYINDSILPIDCTMMLSQRDNPYQKKSNDAQENKADYFAVLSFDRYMSEYIDDRYLKIEFDTEDEEGLKLPLSAITQKEYYIVPLDMFVQAPEESGYKSMLMREIYDENNAFAGYENIYPEKYVDDGYFAYIDTSLLNANDYLYNCENGEKLKVGVTKHLDGVYCVNKGYYQFVRIEKLRQNNEYAIISKSTSGGIRQYDHIAVNAADAIDAAIIY